MVLYDAAQNSYPYYLDDTYYSYYENSAYTEEVAAYYSGVTQSETGEGTSQGQGKAKRKRSRKGKGKAV